MTDAKLRELVNMLTIRTAESKLRWSRTKPDSKFVIEFNNGKITVNSWINKGIKYVTISIYNKDYYKIEDFKFNDQADLSLFDLVHNLYAVIEKKILEADFILDKILDELK